MKEKYAKAISLVFHPLLIPTIGFLVLMNSGFYFSVISTEAKIIVFIVVFLSTFLTPLISLILMNLSSRFQLSMDKSTDRVVPLLFSAIFYYVGYFFLGRLSVYPVYRIFLIASILIIIVLMLISMRWKISAHMAGIGGLVGALIALSLRLEINNSGLIAVLVGIAGLIGSSRLILGKHNSLQIYAGFFVGFAVNFLILVLI